MLAIGRGSSSFSFTNSGKTKSWTLNCVSRTRFRKAGERRKRRGRWINLLIQPHGTLDKLGRKQSSSGSREHRPTINRTHRTQARRHPGFSVCILFVVPRSDYLLIDISNSYAKFAFASRRRLSAPARIATKKLSHSVVGGLLRQRNVRKVVVSSVVPTKNSAIAKAARKRARG